MFEQVTVYIFRCLHVLPDYESWQLLSLEQEPFLQYYEMRPVPKLQDIQG